MTAPPTTVHSSNGVDVVLHDLGGTGSTLMVSHATGFHGRCYLPLAHALADRFHSLALDYRGHGDTPLPADRDGRSIHWDHYADDAEAVATALRERAGGPVVGFGHSMGGACLLMAALRDPDVFERLVLFEPIVFPPPDPSAPPHENRLANGARRRRPSFPSFDAAIESYGSRPPLGSFTPEALDAYVRFGFSLGEDGQVHLKCDPETEARTFENSATHDTWQRLPQIDLPVMVVAGRVEEGQPSAFAGAVAEQLPHGTLVVRDDLDHFGPMSHPDVVASLVTGFAGDHD
ncbi:MAG: alpha/beta fold hydrolase [Ilumatobacteraceae bacterium]